MKNDIVTVHYNRLIIKMSPDAFFESNIGKFLVGSGVDLQIEDCQGLVIKAKVVDWGIIDAIEIFRVTG